MSVGYSQGNTGSQAAASPEPRSHPARAKPRRVKPARTGFRFLDFFIIVLCLSGAIYCLNLFRLDLFQTINLQNVQPVGTVTIKTNIVQRRIADRVLWDRLLSESPVYLGDLIRVAELSSATLNIDGQQIDLNENTLIRIQRAPDGDGAIQIELTEGSLGIVTSEEGGSIQLNLMGRKLEAAPGTALNAAAGNNGIVVQVNEGTALFIEEGRRSREVSSGTMLALDAGGAEQQAPAAVVTRPKPNARYLKSKAEPLSVGFVWNRINLQPEDALRLEIASDRNFNRIISVNENLDDSAHAALNAGQWYWRLSFKNAVLSTGRFTVLDTTGITLQSPAIGSLFRYQNDLPALRFQWSEMEEASNYIIEVCENPDFLNLQMSSDMAAASFVQSNLGAGTWYWRVMPVFSSSYEGSAAYSAVSYFRIEQSAASEEAGIMPAELERVAPIKTEIRLVSPAAEAVIPGLTALREQIEFRWDGTGDLEKTRFILSRNKDILQRPPGVEIVNPERTVSLDRLGEGTWYWTVEAQTAAGLSIGMAEPRQLVVAPIPVLPAAANLVPANGYRINIDLLKTQRTINFSWGRVAGANAYILTLYEISAGRQRTIRTVTVYNTNWTLESLSELTRGTFGWQVEAVNINRNGTIEQRGRAVSSSFIMDIPLPEVQADKPGVLYGR